MSIKTANMQNMKELLNASTTSLLDVRSPMEFAMEHIPGAKNIPINELSFRLDEIKELPKPIIVYCLSGGRSSMAVGILQEAGFTDVFNGGGISNMKQILYN